MKKINPDNFFIIKNGDMFGFHYKKWSFIVGKIINLVSFRIDSERKKLLEIEHIGMVYNVEKFQNTISFSFGESVGHEGGKINNSYIFNKRDGKIIIDSRFRNKGISIFLIPTTRELTAAENDFANEFWNRQENYNVFNAISSVNIFQKLFKLFFKKKNPNKLDNYCMGEVNTFFRNIGFDSDDIMPTPAEIINQSYVNKDGITLLC